MEKGNIEFEKFCSTFSPMLISQGELRALVGNGAWLFEPKLDGMRGIAMIDNGKCRIFSRHGKEHTHRFPLMVREFSAMEGSLIVDGEIACLDDNAKPCLELIQERILMERDIDIVAAEKQHPARFFAFDMVYCNGSLLETALIERKTRLVKTIKKSGCLNVVDHFEENPDVLYHACVENGLEGIVAKRPESIYYPGLRSSYWLKIKTRQTDSFVIGGHTEEHGFLVGQYEADGTLRYCGNVEAGFRNVDYDLIFGRLTERSTSPFLNSRRRKQTTYFEPQIVLEVRFLRWTPHGMIREGVFKALRNDLPPEAVRYEKRAF